MLTSCVVRLMFNAQAHRSVNVSHPFLLSDGFGAESWLSAFIFSHKLQWQMKSISIKQLHYMINHINQPGKTGVE